MTPAIARREVAAAREAGWYVNHWGQKYVPPHKCRGPSGEARFSPLRKEILVAVAAGHQTLTQITAAIPGDLSRDQVMQVFRRFKSAAEWAFNAKRARGSNGEYHLTLTDRGADLLRQWSEWT